MKKRLLIITTLLVFIALVGCNRRERLLILNWGEYINDEVLLKFEEEYNVSVSMSLADSNELFYSKIKSGTTAYDIVVPSDYMVEKMHDNGLLQKIDLSKLTNYDPVNNPFMPGVKGIQSIMFEGNEEYAIPYFWGTFGIMYNKKKAGLEEALLKYGWEAYFEQNKRPEGTRIGMYDVPRFAYAAAMFYNNMDPNIADEKSLNIAFETLSRFRFNEWGTDTLKKAIAGDNLDMAFVYTGDFLDTLYIKLDDNPDLNDITFDIYIPDNTIAFMDTLVIPKKARHVELAHKFIDFMLRPENAYENASVVGYCTPLLKAYNEIVNYEGDDAWLNAWAYANKKYYPLLDNFKGTPIKNLDRDKLNEITNLVNNAKAKW